MNFFRIYTGEGDIFINLDNVNEIKYINECRLDAYLEKEVNKVEVEYSNGEAKVYWIDGGRFLKKIDPPETSTNPFME